MYIEISGRGSGKTTRLVDHASDELLDNINDRNYVIGLVVFNQPNGERIRHMIIISYIDKIRYMGFNVNEDTYETVKKKILIQFDMEPPRARHVNQWYVDEFAFIQSSKLRLNIDAYYCTTPNGNQDFTERIISFCLEKDIDIMSYDMCEQLRVNSLTESEVFDEWCFTHGIYPRLHPFYPTVEGERLNNNLVPKGLKRHRF